jgi:hypothetical protein
MPLVLMVGFVTAGVSVAVPVAVVAAGGSVVFAGCFAIMDDKLQADNIMVNINKQLVQIHNLLCFIFSSGN